MAVEFEVPFLGRVPIDPTFASAVEAEGEGSYVKQFTGSALFLVFQEICKEIVAKVEG